MRVEKTVFISYRRTNASWALIFYKELTHHGFDVFFDYTGLKSGDFEQSLLENIRARAHFLIVLTPSALERCSEPADWLRREIEEAMDCGRNIVPLMLEGFDFGAPIVEKQLTGKLTALKSYNGIGVHLEYFDAAMIKLREKFLDVALDTVLQPVSEIAQKTATTQQAAATAAPKVPLDTLTAQEEPVVPLEIEEEFDVDGNLRRRRIVIKVPLSALPKHYVKKILKDPRISGP